MRRSGSLASSDEGYAGPLWLAHPVGGMSAFARSPQGRYVARSSVLSRAVVPAAAHADGPVRGWRWREPAKLAGELPIQGMDERQRDRR